MTRGYIKEVPGNAQVVGDHMRMRFVKPGNNADSESVPPNQVIFDSDDIGTLSVITTDVYRIPRTQAEPVTHRIASWSDLGYVPLCMFQFQSRDSVPRWYPAIQVLSSTPDHRIIVDRTGITVTLIPSPGYTDIAYQVYRLAVV